MTWRDRGGHLQTAELTNMCTCRQLSRCTWRRPLLNVGRAAPSKRRAVASYRDIHDNYVMSVDGALFMALEADPLQPEHFL